MNSEEWLEIQSTLKNVLKTRKITYCSLAQSLKISETSVKRLLTGEDIKMSRIIEICNCIGISFYKLVQMSEKVVQHQFVMSLEEEEFFCRNPFYYGVLNCLIEGYNVEELITTFNLNKKEVLKSLQILEKMKFIARLNNCKIKLLRKGQHNWLFDGPMSKEFGIRNKIQTLEECDKRRKQKNFQSISYFTHSNRLVSRKTLESIVDETKKIAEKFRLQAQFDENFLPREQLVSAAWLNCATITDYNSKKYFNYSENMSKNKV